ncbi:MAG: class I SAM-dependent methyltransferase [Calditrichota bacterium]
MSEKTKQSVSDSLETSQQLLPHMPYLLQDLWALGSSERDILQSVGSLNLKDKATVLDLGCGKGAITVQLAAKYGYTVTGIDAMPEFLEAARKKAELYGVSNLCKFIEQDILKYTTTVHEFDLVILASLGGIYGFTRNAVAKLRIQVRTGGYIMIDDGYLKSKKKLNRKGYTHLRSHDETIRELVSFGDQLIQEINTSEYSRQINEQYLKVIKKRGQELTIKYPELNNELDAYINLQAEECKVLDTEIEGALWVLRKK